MPFYEPVVLERRALGGLAHLTLHSPELARAARPGHYALARCAPPDSADPLLRRAVFLADANPATGTVALLIEPAERGLAWLAGRAVGEQLDLLGPLGTPFSLGGATRHLLLAGAGPALPALIFLAGLAAGRGLAIVLLAAAPAPALLPPPFLLPPAVEYQSSAEGEQGLLALLAPPTEAPGRQRAKATGGKQRKGQSPTAPIPQPPNPPIPQPPLIWADQLCAALPAGLLTAAGAAVRAARLRWEPGFAQVALAGAMPCGVGACQACLVETRAGLRTRCKDGPVFDLRDLQA